MPGHWANNLTCWKLLKNRDFLLVSYLQLAGFPRVHLSAHRDLSQLLQSTAFISWPPGLTLLPAYTQLSIQIPASRYGIRISYSRIYDRCDIALLRVTWLG